MKERKLSKTLSPNQAPDFKVEFVRRFRGMYRKKSVEIIRVFPFFQVVASALKKKGNEKMSLSTKFA